MTDRLKSTRIKSFGEGKINAFHDSTFRCAIPASNIAISASIMLASTLRRAGYGGRSRKSVGLVANAAGSRVGRITQFACKIMSSMHSPSTFSRRTSNFPKDGEHL